MKAQPKPCLLNCQSAYTTQCLCLHYVSSQEKHNCEEKGAQAGHQTQVPIQGSSSMARSPQRNLL